MPLYNTHFYFMGINTMKKFLVILSLLSTTFTLSACVISTDTPVTIVTPTISQTTPTSVHVCKISAFTETYQAENTSRGKAFLEAKKQCLANFDEMFCRDEEVKCTEYK